MNQEIYRPAELTGGAQNTYSESMPDGISPDVNTQQAVSSQEASNQTSVTPEQFIEHSAGGEIRQPDDGQNTEGDHSVEDLRLTRAEVLLGGIKLTSEQRAAILTAHIVGEGEAGKSEGQAEIGNYTQRQISEKARILESAGFTKEQRRVLMESGLVGMNPPPPNFLPNYRAEIVAEVNAINPNLFQGRLAEIATRIKDLQATGQLDETKLARFGEEMMEMATQQGAVDLAQLKTLNDTVFKIVGLEDLANPTSRYEWEKFLKRYKDLKTTRNSPHEAFEFLRQEVHSLNPQTRNIPDPVIKIIAEDQNALEYLINRIVSAPMDSETGDYQLGFYGGNNLEGILNYLKNEADSGNRALAVEYQAGLELRESVRYAHELNKAIINTDMKAFQGIAALLTDRYLVTLGKVPAVDSVLRLLDSEYQTVLARDGWINGTNHAEIMGKLRDPNTGKILAAQDQSALATFRQEVATARILAARAGGIQHLPRDLRDLAQLEEWQVPWAFNVGKAMHNLWLRSAEWIAQGEYPSGDQQYLSLPQESIVRIFDYRNKMLERFEISEVRGGVEWVETAAEVYSSPESREEDGYGHTEILRVGNKSLQTFESPSETGVRGFMSTWREKQLIFAEVHHSFNALPDSGFVGAQLLRNGKPVGPVGTFADYLDTGSLSFKFNPANPDEEAVPWASLNDAQRGQYLRSLFFDQNWNLLPDINQSLGGFIYMLKPSSRDGEYSRSVKEHLRTKLWERAAQENPLGLISYLQGLQLEGDRKPQDLINHPGIHVDWRSFSRKLEILNEIRLAQIRSGNQVTLDNVIFRNRNIQGLSLTHEEFDMIRLIRNMGRDNPHEAERVAHSLANLRLAFNPFLNEAPLDVNYTITSQEVYRRFINDTGGFDKSNQAKITIMNNPGKYTELKELLEPLTDLVEGSGAVLGTRDGQRIAWPYVEATGEFFERGGNASNRFTKAIRQLDAVDSMLQALHRANSKAQKYAGHKALALDRHGLYEWSEDLRLAGLISEEQEEKFRNRFGAIWRIFLESVLRGTRAALAVGAYTTVKEGFQELPLA